MLRRRHGERDERGAFAVVFALMVVMLLTVAALGTDLGNAISRKTDTQNQADFAAFDAAQKLNESVSASTTVSDDVLDAVLASFNNNQPQDDDRSCWRTRDCISKADLTDTNPDGSRNLANGDVQAVAAGLQVTAPQARVDFGFANVFGADGTSVQSQAIVNIFSGGPRVLPLFGVSGCDWGPQTLTDPAHTPSPDKPVLFANADKGKAVVTAATVKDQAGNDVPEVPHPVTPAGMTVIVEANEWNLATTIGFFHEDGSAPVQISGADLRTSTGDPWTAPDPDAAGGVWMNLPANVASKAGVWYVRALSGTPAKWSPVAEAPPIRVGGSRLECDPTHPGGNFGTLRLPRTDEPALDISMNIAVGLEEPLDLVIHPWGKVQHDTNPGWDGTCDPGVEEQHAVLSTGNTLLPDSNCVDTDPGFPANDATVGFVTGPRKGNTQLAPGLLDRETTCGETSANTPLSVEVQGDNYDLNNDVLSCFLTGGKTLNQIVDVNYNAGAALDKSVFDSPRFAWVPVLDDGGLAGPDHGSSRTYSIVDFRPAFITDENTDTATVLKGSSNASDENGVHFDGNDLKSIKVVFFNWKALPTDTEGPFLDYLGVGPKLIHLID